jgi:hypothetical protein
LQVTENDIAGAVSLTCSEVAALDFFASALIWFEILSCTTTGLKPAYPDIFSWLLHIEDGRIQLHKLMGCKNWVMVIIMDIACLDEWKTTRQEHEDLSLRELARRALVLEERLTAGMRENSKVLSTQLDPYDVRGSESQAVTHVFACSAVTYLHVVTSGANPQLPEIKESVAETLKAFQKLPDARWVRNLVWPFCIAGCMADTEHETDFRAIASEASQDGQVFGKLRKALAIMEECWKGRRMGASSSWSWTTAMASLGTKVLLV